MTSFKVFLLATCLGLVVGAAHNSREENLRPSEWLSLSELQNIPALNEITFEKLERMPANEGANLIDKIYHLAQINNKLNPTFVPNPANVPVYLYKSNGKNVTANLNNVLQKIKQQSNFGNEEVTIFITGLPSQVPSIVKANEKLVQAYIQRYYEETNQKYNYRTNKERTRTSSEEDYSETTKTNKFDNGNLLVIDLGAAISSFKRYVLLDVEQTGDMIGKFLLQIVNEAEVPEEIIHMVGQGVGAHVAGAAARQFTRLTGHKVRRITALDPSRIFTKQPELLHGLARGNADFVDAIHTNTNGLGITARVGDVDFYPNGLTSSTPGTDNIIEASMRATRYFAESVKTGNERNFPAVPANSLKEYKNKNGHGQRTFMGIDTDFDIKGDYMLEVNPNSPYGKRNQAEKQNTFHGSHYSMNSEKY